MNVLSCSMICDSFYKFLVVVPVNRIYSTINRTRNFITRRLNKPNHWINKLYHCSYFIIRGFQSTFVRSFLEREAHLWSQNKRATHVRLSRRTRATRFSNLRWYWGKRCKWESGEDERLLVKWGLTRELRQSVRDDALWSQQILYHWLFDWITNPWDTFVQKGLTAFSTANNFRATSGTVMDLKCSPRPIKPTHHYGWFSD